jgi:Domain of unknown function (DUF5666)
MNADHADTRYPHLDLGDLIAVAAGQPVADRAREHLAGCDHCQLEANRWNLFADGVRALAAVAPRAAQPARPRRTPQRVQVPWRRGMIAAGSLAAAFVLLVGIGAITDLVHMHSSGPSTKTALTAVTGCSQLQEADGTLEQVNGSNLVIQTASGRPVTVTTTPSAFVSISGPLLSDITNGASVRVRGYRSDGTIRAAIVTVGQPFSAVNRTVLVSIQGTVSDSNSAGFTLVTSSGARVPVTTSDRTFVVVPHAIPGQLKPGARIFALGNAGPDGTLSARAVAAVWQLPPGTHVSLSVRDCSTGSIVEALGAIGQASLSS